MRTVRCCGRLRWGGVSTFPLWTEWQTGVKNVTFLQHRLRTVKSENFLWSLINIKCGKLKFLRIHELSYPYSANESYLNHLTFHVRFPSVRVNEPFFFKVHIRHTVTDTTRFVSGCSDRRFQNDKTNRQYVKNDVCVFVCDVVRSLMLANIAGWLT